MARRSVFDTSYAQLAVYRFEAGNPNAGSFFVLLRLLLVITFQFLFILCDGLLPVAVMGC